MKRNNNLKITGRILLYSVILIFTSCNSNKLTSDYPNIYPDKHKKIGLQPNNRNKTDHTPIAAKEFSKEGFYSVSESALNKTHEVKAAAKSNEIEVSDMRIPTRMPVKPISGYEQAALTASLSNEPFIQSVHTFRPDTTTKSTSPGQDSTTNKVAQTPSPEVKNNGNKRAADQSNREIFAIISPIAALLTIPAFILALPVLTLMLLIAAIVFGAVGLKSKRRNLAVLGMILGIVFSAILLFGIIIFLMSPVVIL